jgi:hypothetical protein
MRGPAMTNEGSIRRLQYLLAAIFIGLGGWCVIAPESVVRLTVTPEFQSGHDLVKIAIGAFGSQAMLVGLLAAFTRFTHQAYAALGLAMLPYFVFDWWFSAVLPVFNSFILIDVAGNIMLMLLCAYGYRLSSKSPSA